MTSPIVPLVSINYPPHPSPYPHSYSYCHLHPPPIYPAPNVCFPSILRLGAVRRPRRLQMPCGRSRCASRPFVKNNSSITPHPLRQTPTYHFRLFTHHRPCRPFPHSLPLQSTPRPDSSPPNTPPLAVQYHWPALPPIAHARTLVQSTTTPPPAAVPQLTTVIYCVLF